MSNIVVDMNNPTPPYEQVRREIVEQVRSGELTPGDKLPAIRVLAGDLGLAPGTVARAYKLLEEAQIIVTRRGAGTTVAPGAVAASERSAATTGRESGGVADPDLVALFAGPVADARAKGHGDVEIMASVRAALAGQAPATNE
ncbi:GntR family transcriptional regulator [Brachybacterium sp. 107]|uniref:GntR family transcriptional regulator n=1 Tax=Brachybacterium sp. 107 TaxID=3457736 RepID=UPI0040335EC6